MRSMALRSGGGMAADVPWSLDQLAAKPSTVVGKIGSHNRILYTGGGGGPWRTCQLGVPVSRQLYDLKPWEHVSIDVFKGLFPNGAKFMFKLEEVLAHTGIEIPEIFQPALAIDGSMVKELFEAGEIEKLRLYNSLDVWATREITQWGGGVYWPRVI